MPSSATVSDSKAKKGLDLATLLQYVVLILISLLMLVPIVILIFAALKTRGAGLASPHSLPIPIYWGNITKILGMDTFWTMLRNSLLVMVASTVGVVFVCSLAAFVFARMKFRGQGLAFNILTLGLMFPINVAILPVFLVLRDMHLTDNLWGVVFVQTAFAMSGNILILRGFFQSIPSELQDAAYIDGCTTFDFFRRVLLPLARPALGAVAALTMVVSWNDVLVPLVVLNSDNKWTLPLGTMQFQGQYSGSDIALTAAFIALSAIPAILFYLVAERQIVSGLTAGAIKG
jgi:raffinose/stachyose/melibiose transport system permease protein